MAELTYTDFDREIWDKDLEDFVPDTVYDMHTHMWSEAHCGSVGGPPVGLRLEIDFRAHRDWAQKLYPGREFHLLVLGTPIPGIDYEGHNDWMAAELKADPASAINMLVSPAMTPEYIAEQVDKHKFLGLKPYRIFAPDPVNGRIKDFLPESFIEVAHDKNLAITMHLAKPTGPADADNQRDLERYTREYPGAQWILAHCARSFNAFMMEDSIRFLCDLPNIWYDTSAVNDLYSHFLLMKHEDRKRVMFGSDNVVAGCARGKFITYGRAWLHYPGNEEGTSHCDSRATLVIYEQLIQERQVAEMLELGRDEIEDHFAGNAKRFLARMREAQSS